MFELNAGAERTQTQGTVLHPHWEGWFPWLLSLIRRAIKEVEQPTKGRTHWHTEAVLSRDWEVSGFTTHNPLG